VPNWVRNIIRIAPENAQEILDEIIAKKILVKTDSPDKWDFDFNVLVSMPASAHPNWFEWRIDKWGSKWNPTEVEVDFGDGSVSFLTAGVPAPIIQALSTAIPHISFEWLYADDDYGNNCGRYICRNGEIVSVDEPADYSSAARNIFAECWGIDDCMYQDKEGNWMKYDCEKCPHPCQ